MLGIRVAQVDLFLIRVAVTVESLERIFLYVISVSLSLYLLVN